MGKGRPNRRRNASSPRRGYHGPHEEQSRELREYFENLAGIPPLPAQSQGEAERSAEAERGEGAKGRGETLKFDLDDLYRLPEGERSGTPYTLDSVADARYALMRYLPWATRDAGSGPRGLRALAVRMYLDSRPGWFRASAGVRDRAHYEKVPSWRAHTAVVAAAQFLGPRIPKGDALELAAAAHWVLESTSFVQPPGDASVVFGQSLHPSTLERHLMNKVMAALGLEEEEVLRKVSARPRPMPRFPRRTRPKG